VGADQVGIVDIGVVDVLARLHLGLQLLDHVAFADQVVRDLDAGDVGERLGQRFGFIFVGGDRFRDDLDVHAGKRLGGIDEPLHLGFLRRPVERRHVADLGIEEGLGLVHSGIGLAGADQERNRRRRC
jgi:hypothetical protein